MEIFLLLEEDKLIDQYCGMAKKINLVNKDLDDEIKVQNMMIGNLDKNTLKSSGQVKKTMSKLDEFITKSSKCCLFSFIAIEIFIIVLILMA